MSRYYGGTAAISNSITQRVWANLRAKEKAIIEVRPIVGDVSGMAFDSAEAVYTYAMNQRGLNVSQYAPTSRRDIVHGIIAGYRQQATPGTVAGTPLADLEIDRFMVIK